MTLKDIDTQPPNSRPIEHTFPIGFVSKIAEHESWRKEIYRPLSYIHKWWARRLGSVFRAIIISACAEDYQDVSDLQLSSISFPDKVIYDPFMGSGTTIHEAVKLGCRVIGRDINPVAYTMVRTALQPYDREEVKENYQTICADLSPIIRKFYTCKLPDDSFGEGLYYFWVKYIPCPICKKDIELFKSRIFAKHAYPDQHPASQASCPHCHAVNIVHYESIKATCHQCRAAFDPQEGVFSGSKVRCPHCSVKFTLIDAVRALGRPLEHRLYAKLALDNHGEKHFLPIDEYDESIYCEIEHKLHKIWDFIPKETIKPGYNTNQVINYGYHYWHQMFNNRQLVALGLIAQRVSQIPNVNIRMLLSCLFSGTIEFNNMFASFKGIGTGAVRHMFSHHILKPEMMPLEANVWGTDQSSGSFSTLFESRILRALNYKDDPFEIRLILEKGKPKNEKIFDISQHISIEPVNNFKAFTPEKRAYLSLGDSGETDIATKTVDIVVTDPPFFDNVHYSELADFFYVWLRRVLPNEQSMRLASTRSSQEVQHTDATLFGSRLSSVFTDCYRVLKDDGLLIFTYHHTKTEGWTALYAAIRQAGFIIVKAHPVKSEMSVSVPVQQSKTPVNFDLIFVCRKQEYNNHIKARSLDIQGLQNETVKIVKSLLLEKVAVKLGDIKIILMGCAMSSIQHSNHVQEEIDFLKILDQKTDILARHIADMYL